VKHDLPEPTLRKRDRDEQVPIDGEVIEGTSSFNEAFLTGESRPVVKKTNDEVVAGAVNGEGALTIKVIRTGDKTTLSQIMRLVEEAQASKSQYQTLADRLAYWLTLTAIGAGTNVAILLTERLLHLALACRRHAQTLRYRQRAEDWAKVPH
jgi:P-type E1-E2 ATPase